MNNFKRYGQIVKALWDKKTFQRIFLNNIVNDLNIQNSIILDIGGGDKTSSYHKILEQKGNKFISVDISKNSDYNVNLEQDRLPFDGHSIDVIFCFNVMEHIFNYENLVSEMARILKPKGKLYFYVPFLIRKHADPYDFFRYTDNALLLIFCNFDFKNIIFKNSYGIGKNIYSSIQWVFSTDKLWFLSNILSLFFGLFFSLIDFLLSLSKRTKKINENFIVGIYMEADR